MAQPASHPYRLGDRPVLVAPPHPTRSLPLLTHFLLTLVLGTGYFQVRHTGLRVYEVYVNRHGVAVGQYTQFTRQDPFVAQCTGAQAVPAWDENAARKYVQRCPGAKD